MPGHTQDEVRSKKQLSPLSCGYVHQFLKS